MSISMGSLAKDCAIHLTENLSSGVHRRHSNRNELIDELGLLD